MGIEPASHHLGPPVHMQGTVAWRSAGVTSPPGPTPAVELQQAMMDESNIE